MKITFVVPALNLTGGIRVVSTYADMLAKKGHTVTVVSPNQKKPTAKEKIKSVLKWKQYRFESGFNTSFFDKAIYVVKVLDKYRPVVSDDVPDADVVIATFWSTAEWVADFPEIKGKKIYFIQHYEVHPWLPIERVKATLQLPFYKIVVAQWIADVLKKEYGEESTVINNAVDHKFFTSPVRKKNKQVKFCMMYSQRSYKGSQFAFECFKQLHEQYPATKLIAFGIESIENVVGLPNGAEYFYQPEQDRIRDIYSQCDAYLFTSSVEGFGLPILEAMACRTPVIGTECGAAPDLLKSGGGVLIDIGDKDALLFAMVKLYNLNEKAWELMSKLAYNEAISHQWEDKTEEFECVLSNHNS